MGVRVTQGIARFCSAKLGAVLAWGMPDRTFRPCARMVSKKAEGIATPLESVSACTIGAAILLSSLRKSAAEALSCSNWSFFLLGAPPEECSSRARSVARRISFIRSPILRTPTCWS